MSVYEPMPVLKLKCGCEFKNL